MKCVFPGKTLLRSSIENKLQNRQTACLSIAAGHGGSFGVRSRPFVLIASSSAFDSNVRKQNSVLVLSQGGRANVIKRFLAESGDDVCVFMWRWAFRVGVFIQTVCAFHRVYWVCSNLFLMRRCFIARRHFQRHWRLRPTLLKMMLKEFPHRENTFSQSRRTSKQGFVVVTEKSLR